MISDIYLSSPDKNLRTTAVDNNWFDDSDTNWRMGFGRGLSGGVAFRDQFLSDLSRPDTQLKVIGVYHNLTPIGFATIETASAEHKTVRLSLFISKEYRGRAFSLTALYKLLRTIFNAGAYRVEIETLKINKKAIKWLRYKGFTQESIKRSAHWMENNVFDSVVLRMLRPEFKRVYNDQIH
jgi:RimJ/RimL family protein N-acetyltransferase